MELHKMEIKVLGTGCQKCKSLEKVTLEAVAEIGNIANVEKVEDIMKIMEYGVMSTPALVIDGDVVLTGKVPSVSQMKEIIIQKK